MDKEIIKSNFSRCAAYYDRYCNIQNFCAQRLLQEIKSNNFSKILEIGCGTGNYTRLLRKKFPQAAIWAVDISAEMAKQAREKMAQDGIEFIVGDGEKINFCESFDLISANASFQWFENLPHTLSKYKNLLNQGGAVFFSQFGPATFCELHTALQKFFGRDIYLTSAKFIARARLQGLMQRVFRKVSVKRQIFQEQYNSLTELLRKIKYTGVRGQADRQPDLWSVRRIKAIEKIYRKKFKGITATYEIFFCEGLK